jgi:O-acetyl-ADP-ribose deacetylase (regulator of RNase III)
MIILDGDLLDVRRGIIIHQSNSCGSMGAGIAKVIRHKWPIVYVKYMDLCHSKQAKDLLGTTQLVNVASDLYVANLFGQLDYGRDKQKYTDYVAVGKALAHLKQQILSGLFPSAMASGVDVYCPFHMGCGLAGGDWEVYRALLVNTFPEITVYKLPS